MFVQRSTAQLHLDLGGIDLGELTEKLKGKARYIALKVPENFHVPDFKKDCISGRITVDKNFRKMLLLIVDFDI